MQTVLLIAADSRELSGVCSLLPAPVRLQWPVAYAFRAEEPGRRWFLVANGPGPRLARKAMDAALANCRPDVVVNTGFCGGLDPALRAGDVFVADRVIAVDTSREFAAARPDGSQNRSSGAIACGDRVIQTVGEKLALRRRTGASAVDMESAAVAERAADSNLPFHCLRVVSDAAGDTLTIDFNAARDAEGRFRTSSILAQALRKPWIHVPELLRLNRTCRIAASNLGEFLVHCRYS